MKYAIILLDKFTKDRPVGNTFGGFFFDELKQEGEICSIRP